MHLIPKTPEFAPGDKLSNNATVIEYDEDMQKVLAVWDVGRDPYVIWTIDQVTGEPYRGFYFQTLEHAMEVWNNRGGRG